MTASEFHIVVARLMTCRGREKSFKLQAQYWETSVKKVNEFYWLLRKFTSLRCDVDINDDAGTQPSSPRRTYSWQSHAYAATVKADPSYPTFVQDCAALATKHVYEVYVPLSRNPQRLLEVPVTEVDFYKLDDVNVNPVAKPVAEAQEMIRHVLDHIESLQLPGLIAYCWGADIEDETRAVTLGGWISIEVRLLTGMLSEPFTPSLLSLPFCANG